MTWDIQLDIEAPIEKVFHLACQWHTFPSLRKIASVPEYHLISTDGIQEYFWIKVRDMFWKPSYCYGKRMLRKPDMIVTMFLYRHFRKKKLHDAALLESMIHEEWDKFFFQTTRLTPLGPRATRLYVNEPGSESATKEDISHVEGFYRELKHIAEGQLLRLGVNAVAEPVDSNEEVTGDWHDSFGEGHQNVEDDYIDVEDESNTPMMDDSYDPYKILGIPDSSSADQVKQAYRQLVKQWHPDRLARANPARREYGHNQFIEVTAAYHAILRMHQV